MSSLKPRAPSNKKENNLGALGDDIIFPFLFIHFIFSLANFLLNERKENVWKWSTIKGFKPSRFQIQFSYFLSLKEKEQENKKE